MRFAAILLASAALLSAAGPAVAQAKKPGSPKGAAAKPAPKRKGKLPADAAKTEAVLHVHHAGRPLGSIVLRFFPESAPVTVRRFLDLAAAGFYDGTHFHRVIPAFLVQGGDPRSREKDRSRHGTGYFEKAGRPQFVPGEPSGRLLRRGVVGFARGMNPDSGSSQFFILVGDAPHLDRQYTVLGEVIAGMDVADRISTMPRDGRDNPVEDVVIQSVELREAGVPAPVAAGPGAAPSAPARAPVSPAGGARPPGRGPCRSRRRLPGCRGPPRRPPPPPPRTRPLRSADRVRVEDSREIPRARIPRLRVGPKNHPKGLKT